MGLCSFINFINLIFMSMFVKHKVLFISFFFMFVGGIVAFAQVPPPPPPGGIGGTACHLLGSNSTVLQGFAPPYSVFDSAKSLLIQVFCSSSGATVSAGAGSSNEIVYNTGYKWMASQNKWVPITFTGTNYSGSTAWLAGSGNASISSSQVESGTNYVVGYICTNVNSQWKCGCSDQTCATNRWQLQTFDNAGGGTVGGGGGGTTGGGTSATTLTNLRNVFAYKFQVISSGSGYVVVPMPAGRVMKIFPIPFTQAAGDTPGWDTYASAGTPFEVWWAGLPEDVECWKGQTPPYPRIPGWGVGSFGSNTDPRDITTPSGTQRLVAPYGQPTLAGITKLYVQCTAVKGFRSLALWKHEYESQISNTVGVHSITPGSGNGITITLNDIAGEFNTPSNPGHLPGATGSSGYGVGGSLTVKINGVPITKPDGTSSVIPGGPLNIEWSASSHYKACEGFAASYFQPNDLLPTSGSATLSFNQFKASAVPTYLLMCAGPGN